MMKCLICGTDAKVTLRPGLWLETDCNSGCGGYRLAAELVTKLPRTHHSFDVARTRSWLDRNRKAVRVPLISSYDYRFSLLGGQ